jgi:MFS family permease
LQNTWSWRLPSLLQGLIPAIQLAFSFFIPESPRFLFSHGRVEEARAVLSKYHGGNKPEYEDLIEFEMSEIKTALEYEKASKEISYKAFIQTKANRHRLFIIMFLAATSQLAGNGLVSYYLNLILNSIGITEARRQLLINGALMAYNIATAVFAGLMCGRIPRRPNLLIGIGAMAIFYIIWTVLSAINQQRNFEQTALGEGVLAMIFLYYAAYNFSLNALPNLYLTEVLPYYLRAKGTTIYVVTQAIVLVYNGFVNPVAMDAISWRYYIVFCCLLVFEFTVVYFTL